MEDGQNPKRDISAEISGYHLAGRAGEAGPVAFNKKRSQIEIMRKSSVCIVACAAVLALVLIPLFAQQRGGQQEAGAQPAIATGRGGQPASARGGLPPAILPRTNEDPLPKVPIGFTPIFNGKDLTGWHISKTNHHGVTPDYHVMHGSILVGTQNPLGRGGILLSDKKYKNVEVYMEVKPDYGCDSGLFLHTDEAGGGYQVMLDYLPEGNMASGIYGERLTGVQMNGPSWDRLSPEVRQEILTKRMDAWQRVWKREQWNSVRARIEGNPPRITTWLNDEMLFQGTDTANHATGGALDGFIAIQIHGAERWRAGGFWRWRVIAVKELPD